MAPCRRRRPSCGNVGPNLSAGGLAVREAPPVAAEREHRIRMMQRVLVIGSGGSGKSTVAKEIARRLHLPLVHLDALYWQPGWRATPTSAWERVVHQLIAAPWWVMDGNYGGTLDVRLAACDTVVFLDVPRVICLWRILRRRLQFRRGTRADMAPRCPERLTWEFVRWV